MVCKYYRKDPTFVKVLAHPEVHPHFRIKDGLIWTKNQMKKDMVCLPWKAFLWGRRLVEVIINHAHTTIGHFGQLGTSLHPPLLLVADNGYRYRTVLQLGHLVPSHEGFH